MTDKCEHFDDNVGTQERDGTRYVEFSSIPKVHLYRQTLKRAMEVFDGTSNAGFDIVGKCKLEPVVAVTRDCHDRLCSTSGCVECPRLDEEFRAETDFYGR